MSVPFARFNKIMAAVAAAIGAGLTRASALERIGPYESHGKSNGRRQASRNTTAQVKRAAVKARNRAKHRRLS